MPIARDDFEINQFLLLMPCPLGALYNFPENLTLSAAVFSSREPMDETLLCATGIAIECQSDWHADCR